MKSIALATLVALGGVAACGDGSPSDGADTALVDDTAVETDSTQPPTDTGAEAMDTAEDAAAEDSADPGDTGVVADADVADTSPPCEGESDETLCSDRNKECGALTVTDRCGNTRNVASCGSCTSPEVCGVPSNNVCGCRDTVADFCAREGASCGVVTAQDKCGVERTYGCGACPLGGTCDVNQCVGGWQTETVQTQTGIGGALAMALDDAGQPHIVYRRDNTGGGDLVYARRSGSAWTVTTVDDGVFSAIGLAIAFDPAGTLHIARNAFDGLVYTTREASGWSDEVARGIQGRHASLAFGADGTPYMLHVGQTTGHLELVTRDAEGDWDWSYVDKTADPSSSVGEHNTLIVGSDGTLHAGYFARNFFELRYTRRAPGGDWGEVVVDDTPISGYDASMALDSVERPVIAYHRSPVTGADAIRLARFDGTDWSTEQVSTNVGAISANTGIVVDADDRVHVTWYDVMGRKVYHAVEAPSGWTLTPLATAGTGNDSVYTVLALDGQGRLHAAWGDVGNGKVTWARLDPVVE